MNKFALALATIMASGFCKSEDQSYKEDFKRIDSNQDGFIDPIDLRLYHEDISSQDISIYFIATDLNEDGLIDLEEFTVAMKAH